MPGSDPQAECTRGMAADGPFFLIRAARPEEAAALSRLAQRVFHQTFSSDPDHKAEDMAAYLANDLSPATLAKELGDPALSYHAAFAGEEMIGYSKAMGGEAPHCVVGSRPFELCRMYVDFDWHGQGVAAALMRRFIEQGIERGSDVLWLGVWHRNVRAQRFYRKWRFEQVGAHPFQFGTDMQEDLVFARRAWIEK